MTVKTGVREIEVSSISPPDEIARLEINPGEIEELVTSIRSQGLLFPILVNTSDSGLEIIDGHRRYIAHQRLKLSKILCRVVKQTPKEVAVNRAVANLQRVNLTPLEEAYSYKGLKDRFDLDLEALSQLTGKSPGVVQRRLDIIRMPQEFQDAIHKKQISMTVAEELWSCPDASYRSYLLEMAVEHGVTSAVARQWVEDKRKEMRGINAGNGGGGLSGAVYENEPIYRSCDCCRGPVDYSKVIDVRVCPQCGDIIMGAIKEGIFKPEGG